MKPEHNTKLIYCQRRMYSNGPQQQQHRTRQCLSIDVKYEEKINKPPCLHIE
jgi:hypothetical protein